MKKASPQVEISRFALNRIIRQQKVRDRASQASGLPISNQSLVASFEAEIRRMLSYADCFVPNALGRALGIEGPLEAISKLSPGRSRLDNANQQIFQRQKSHFDSAESHRSLRFALALLHEADPIHIAVPADLVASIGLLTFLKLSGVPLRINYSYSHALDVVNHIKLSTNLNPPDFCVLSLGPAMGLIRSTSEYWPEAVMPRTSREIVAPRAKSGEHHISYGTYIFMSENPGTSSLYFHELERQGVIVRRRVRVENFEPDEAASVLHSGDPSVRAILGFPYYFFNELMNACVKVTQPVERLSSGETILFAREGCTKALAIKQSLIYALYHGWHALIRSPYLISAVTTLMLQDDTYRSFLLRASGFHSIAYQPTNSRPTRELGTPGRLLDSPSRN